MPRITQIETNYYDRVSEAATKYGDHEGMGIPHIINWMQQFEDDELVVAAKVLKNIRYYSSSNIRAMTRELCQIISDSYSDVPINKLAFVPIGGPGSSSEIIMRVLRDIREIRGSRILRLIDLIRLRANEVSHLVFIDDFCGTGSFLKEWWDEQIESLVLPLEATVVVALLVLNYRAEDTIAEFTSECRYVKYLNKADDVFSDDCQEFSLEEKEILDKYCKRTSCSEEYVHGRGRCGLLLSFTHGCPNNSVPILWHDSRSWRSLFRRHAI